MSVNEINNISNILVILVIMLSKILTSFIISAYEYLSLEH